MKKLIALLLCGALAGSLAGCRIQASTTVDIEETTTTTTATTIATEVTTSETETTASIERIAGENLGFTMKAISVSKTGVTLYIHNGTENYWLGTSSDNTLTLSVWENNQWNTLDFINDSYTTIADMPYSGDYYEYDSENIFFKPNWSELYGALPEGKYQIQKNCTALDVSEELIYEDDRNTEITLTTTFKITNDTSDSELEDTTPGVIRDTDLDIAMYWDESSMFCAEDGWSNTDSIFHVVNKSDYVLDMGSGNNYYIEVKKNDTWVPLEKNTIEGTYSPASFNHNRLDIIWGTDYGELETGMYRIVKGFTAYKFNENNDLDCQNFDLTCEFHIGKVEFPNGVKETDLDTSMETIENTVTPTGASFKVTNNTEYYLAHADEYCLQVLQNGEWVAVLTADGTEYQREKVYDFVEGGMYVVDDPTFEVTADWTDIYGELPAGTYRIIKEFEAEYWDDSVSEEVMIDDFDLTAEFTIE